MKVQIDVKVWGMRFWLLFLALMLPMSAGWAGDSLLDLIRLQTSWPAGASWYCLDGWFGWWQSVVRPWSPLSHARMAGTVGGTVIFGLTALALYRARRMLLTTHARVLPDATPDRRTVLIMGLSPKYPPGGPDAAKVARDAAIAAMRALPIEVSILDDDAQKERQEIEPDNQLLNDLVKGRPAWQQGLRIVWHHIAAPSRTQALKAVLIVTSDKSHSDFTEFREFLLNRLADAKQRGLIKGTVPTVELMTPSGLDFEDYNSVVDTLNMTVDKALDRFKVGHGQICLDATAGLKIFSIATAMVTLNRKLIFSYVNQAGQPRYYDAKIDMGTLGEG